LQIENHARHWGSPGFHLHLEGTSMRPSCFGLLVGSLAFFSGVACFNSWLLFTRPAIGDPDSRSLEMISGSETYRKQGVDQTYQMSDGSWIHSSCDNFHSSADATEELQRRVREVPGVLYREPNIDMNGRVAGERVVVNPHGLIGLWTHDNVFCKAEATSLPVIQWRLVR
jgi:hypothetical protein